MMYRLALIILLCLAHQAHLLSQDKKNIDSLLQIFKTADRDSTRLGILLDLSEEYYYIQLNRSLDYAEKALLLSRKLNNKIGIARSLNNLAKVCIEQGNYEDAQKFSEESLQIYKQLDLKGGIASNLTNEGLILHYRGAYEKALDYYQQAIDLNKKDSNHVAKNMNYIGRVYQNQSNYDIAMEHFVNALRISESRNDKAEIANSLGKISEIHSLQNNYKEAIEYATQALHINKETGNKRGLEANLNNLGDVHLKLGEYEKALQYFQESLKLLQEIAKKQEIASRLGNIGTAYFYLNDLEKAKEFYRKALDIETQLGNKRVVAYVLLNLGYVFKQQGDNKTAIEYFNKSLDISREIGKKNLMMISYLNLSQLHGNIGEFKKAYELHQAYATVNDSILGENSRKQLAEIQTKYETEKKEKEIALLKSDQIVKMQKLKENQARLQLLTLVTIVLAVIVVFVTIFIRMYRQKLQANKLLSEKNEEIQDQKMNVLMKNQKIELIKASVEAREQERHRVSKELHDGIGGSLAAIKLSLSRYEDDARLNEVIKSLDKTCQEVRTLSHDLIPPNILNSIYTVLLEDYISKVSALHPIELSFHCYPEDEINGLDEIIQAELYRIIQELLSNMIKHSKASSGSVQISKPGDCVNLMVEDNGIGFSLNKKMNGIGLLNIQSRVKKLNGKVQFDTNINRGTIVNIDIPLFEPKLVTP